MSRSSRRLTVIAAAIAVIGVLAFLLVSWLGTYRDARDLQSQVTALRSSIAAKDWRSVTAELPGALDSAVQLEDSSSGLPWRLLEAAPVLGSSASAVGDLAATSVNLLDAAQPLLPFAQRLADGGLRRADGSVDLAAVTAAAPMLEQLARVVDGEVGRLDRIDASSVRAELAGPLVELRQQLHEAAPALAASASFAERLPALLGAGGERSWLVLLQNPAEARGTGGFPGGYVRITARDGRLSVASVGRSDDLNARAIPTAGAPSDARLLWGDLLSVWRTFNLSPDFPLAGSLAAAGMAARGEPVDGVVAIDPRTVAALLSVVGPVTADGQTITADTAERFFTVDAYAQYPDMQRRSDVTVALVGAVLEKFLGTSWDPVALADALSGPIEQGRVRAWSADPDEEAWLATTPVGGSVPNTGGPVVAVAFNNAAGNKMDAFVSSAVDYRPGQCSTSPTQHSQLAITLENDAPDVLPDTGDYGRADDPSGRPGSTRMLVHVYAPVGARFTSATLNGVPIDLYSGTERNRPVWWTSLELDRGARNVLDLRFDEPTVAQVEPAVLPQGMVHDEKISVRPDSACS